ncbi:hypothetical protein [Qipengyuania soli]|uniref:Uncharacterized protein n=1 Tax=Qipengyuania soli TaxID=2782568 RepID=A0A7S8IT73_9SPHN|nr:hypothetical protein [Qipengyuania soli]QPC99738.1 hypothetical protein IRL76_04070 [Qipengyuania soli]
MAAGDKRDNDYYLKRLKKDGHDDMLEQIEAGQIKVYEATKRAGYRKTGPRDPALVLSYHWKRASHEDRKRFVLANAREVNRVLKEIAREARERKAKKPSE